MVEAYVGVDIGTGSARAGVFDASGALLASARRPIAIWRDPGEIVEHSSSDIWAAATAAVREAVAVSGLRSEAFAGLGFDATCSLVVLDAEGRALPVGPSGAAERDTIVWMDHRATREAAEIDAGGHPALRYVGGKISPEMQPPKLLWLARHRPDTFGSAAHFFDLTDFLTWRATGDDTRSLCTLTCKWLYLAHETRWPADFLQSIGLGVLAGDGFHRIGANVAAPGAPLGRGLTRASAEAMGLPEGLPVGAGLIDAHAGAVGTLGARLDGASVDPLRQLALILGTSSCCMALAEAPRFIDGVWGPYFNALIPGRWLAEGGQSAFGAAMDHLMKLHPRFAEIERDAGAGAFERLERDILAEAGDFSAAALMARDLHVLPDFLGNRSPYADPAARGAVLGLDLREDHASLLQLYVAGLSGLAQGLAQVVRTLEAGSYAFDRLVVSGGAARSPLVRQLLADCTGKPVSAPQSSEPVLLGAAMLGAVAAGRRTMGSAMADMSSLGKETRPAGGAIAAFHRAKRAAFETLQQTEQKLRATMRAPA